MTEVPNARAGLRVSYARPASFLYSLHACPGISRAIQHHRPQRERKTQRCCQSAHNKPFHSLLAVRGQEMLLCTEHEDAQRQIRRREHLDKQPLGAGCTCPENEVDLEMIGR